jgi:hypothetical protein
MTENGDQGMVTEIDDPEMVTENDVLGMVTETGDPEMVTKNVVRGMVTETGDPKMVTNAKEGAGILTEDKEEMTELAVERKETGKMVEKITPKNHAKEVAKTETREKDRAPETGKARGNKIIEKTLTKIVPTRNQKARRLHRRKAWEVFCPNFLASKTSFGPQNEMIHAHSGSI